MLTAVRVLDNLIAQASIALATIKLRHPATPEAPHNHTVAYITQDASGFYWLEMKCRHDYCQGTLRKRLLPEQVEAWGLD